jgi:hypothetical protein
MYPHSAHARKSTPHLKNEPSGYLLTENELIVVLLLVSAAGRPPPPLCSSSSSSYILQLPNIYGIYFLGFPTVTFLAHFNQTPQNIILPVPDGNAPSLYGEPFDFTMTIIFLQLHNTTFDIQTSVRPEIFSPVPNNDFSNNICFSIEPLPAYSRSFL